MRRVIDDLTQPLKTVWTNPAAGWILMKAKLWEVQTTEMQRRSGVRSFGVAPEMQTLSASHCTHNAREQLNGGIAELEEEERRRWPQRLTL